MKKYRKFKRGKTLNPYIIFIIVIVGICAMSVGYAVSSDTMFINGRANAKYSYFTITYVLNGGTNPENPITQYRIIDDDLLPIPTKEGYKFAGWYYDEDFDGERKFDASDLEGNVTLYAKWKSENAYYEEYRHDEPFTFTGSNYLDTGIALYSEANWQKDFEMGFTIDEYVASQNVNQAVFFNSKYEVESLKFPGLVVRRDADKNAIEVTQQINHGIKAIQKFNTPAIPCTVKVYRISGVIYYSVNGGGLIQVQNMSNFNQQFDLTAWFGAAPDENGNVIRGLVGTLSNMYVRIEEYETKKYTVTFNANGGTVSPASRRVKEFNEVGELPIPTYERRYFQGWYANPALTTPVSASTIINSDTTFYAKWSDSAKLEVNGNYYTTLAEAINAVPESNEYVTIHVYEDMKSKVTIPAGKKIILDLQESILSNDGNNAVIENNGDLKIINGTITSSTSTGAINNNEGATLTITGGEVIATGTKQAVYNNGGTTIISGDAFLSSNSTIRAAVHNLNNGELIITGGTIVSYGQCGIENANGTMTIGTKDGTIDTQAPLIQGKTYGITSTPNYSVYDGTIIGRTNAVNKENLITDIEINSEISHHSEVVEGVTYKSIYLTATE
ncbi:MAG: InlB B-repeat-containing protein [Clostridia bacterium]|nr:InlB B-repeat-containing protein [Clostridia bacterium]